MKRFVIPDRDDDLLEPSNDTYYVTELEDDLDNIDKAITRMLKSCDF